MALCAALTWIKLGTRNKLKKSFVVENYCEDPAVIRMWQIVASFATMYAIATILGFATYLLLSPTAMWVSVFTLMPAVSAWLIYRYLRKMKFTGKTSMAESAKLLAVWICLSFALDALVFIAVIPFLMHTSPNWNFFRDQSPWIWLSYAVLLVSGYAGRRAYLRSLNA